jgi:cytochrome c oxidase cbb3-type subunit 1
MDWFVKAFIRASLAWFAAGIVLGVAMALQPAWVIYRPAHAHMNVVGFLTMMVFGVGYQLLPRLFGHKLYSNALAVAHWWAANLGLGAMIVGFILAPHTAGRSGLVTAAGGIGYAAGALGFVFNMWRTFNLAEARQRARGAPDPDRRLPTLE